MKTNLKYVVVACCLFSATFQLYSQGYIIANGVTNVGFNGIGYEITVIQNPTNEDYTGFSLDPTGKTPPTVYTNTYQFNPFLDEQVRTFLVSSNDSISLQPIMSGAYTELLYPNTYVFTNAVPFYLGFYTGYTPSGGIYSNPVFGWGEFVNNQGAIEMLNSALEIQGGGIYAGTQNIIPVPEPSEFALLGLGGLFFGFRRWRCNFLRWFNIRWM